MRLLPGMENPGDEDGSNRLRYFFITEEAEEDLTEMLKIMRHLGRLKGMTLSL